MRFYSFTNSYLSSIQQGIQTAHLIAEMSLKGDADFVAWATRHKTIVVLNGGNSRKIAEAFLFLMAYGNDFPTAIFKEDEESLNDAITAAGIVLPSAYCACIDSYRETGNFFKSDSNGFSLSSNHEKLIKFIAEHSLAR